MKKQQEKKVELEKQVEKKVEIKKQTEKKEKKKKRKNDADGGFWGELFGEILLEGFFVIIWRILTFIPRLIFRLIAALFD